MPANPYAEELARRQAGAAPGAGNPYAAELQRRLGAKQSPDPLVANVQQQQLGELDTRTGAPARTRFAVGAAVRPEDKLSTIQKLHPGAAAYEYEGSPNYVIPGEGGRPTLYNPPGLELGSLAESAPMLGEIAGGVAGGALGAVGGPAGATAGMVGGSLAGKRLVQNVASLAGAEDTRTAGQTAVDTGIDAALAYGGAKLGDLALKGAGALKRGVLGSSKPGMAQAFKDLKIRPVSGAVTNSNLVSGAENLLAGTPGGAGIMQRSAEETLEGWSKAADNIASKYGTVRFETTAAGADTRRAALHAIERIKTEAGKLYDDAYNLAGQDAPVSLDTVRTFLAENEALIKQAGPGNLPGLAAGVARAKKLLKGAGEAGVVPLAVFRKIRTELGADLDSPMQLGATASQRKGLDGLYAAMSQDMHDSVAAQGGKAAAAALKKADDNWARMMGDNKDLASRALSPVKPRLEKLINEQSDEKIWAAVESMTRKGGDSKGLATLKAQFTPAEWGDLSGTVLGRLTLANPGAQTAEGNLPSAITFLTNWSKMPSAAKKVLWGHDPTLMSDLNKLAKVAEGLKDTARTANPSGTGRMVAYLAALSGAGALLAGDVTSGAATGAVAATGGAWAAAKLVTHPKFVHWLVSGPGSKAQLGAKATGLAGLAQLAEKNPEIAEDVRKFADYVRSDVLSTVTAPAGNAPGTFGLEAISQQNSEIAPAIQDYMEKRR